MAMFRKFLKPSTHPPEPNGLDEPGLMLEAARGSEAAYETLVRRYQGVLMNLFRGLGAQHDEAEDAVQETFLRIHAYRFRYRPTASFRTFLFTVARRTWLDLCRRRNRRRRLEAAGADPGTMAASAGPGPDLRLDLEAGLAELPEGQRMVLVLSLYGGLLYEEIATVLGIPEGTVKSRVFHALRKLRARESRDAVR